MGPWMPSTALFLVYVELGQLASGWMVAQSSPLAMVVEPSQAAVRSGAAGPSLVTAAQEYEWQVEKREQSPLQRIQEVERLEVDHRLETYLFPCVLVHPVALLDEHLCVKATLLVDCGIPELQIDAIFPPLKSSKAPHCQCVFVYCASTIVL